MQKKTLQDGVRGLNAHMIFTLLVLASFPASHLLPCVTLLLQPVLFLNQSNVVVLYPAAGGVGVGASLRRHAKGTMSEMKNLSSKVSRGTNQRDPSRKNAAWRRNPGLRSVTASQRRVD